MDCYNLNNVFCDNLIVFYCFDCNIFLCSECFIIHSKKYILQHNTITFKKYIWLLVNFVNDKKKIINFIEYNLYNNNIKNIVSLFNYNEKNNIIDGKSNWINLLD